MSRHRVTDRDGRSPRWKRLPLIVVVSFLGLVLSNCTSLVPRNSWNSSWGPTVPHDTFPGECTICHYADRWEGVKPDFVFDHGKETGYLLVGAHTRAACLRCHNDRGPVEAYVDRGCGGCHTDPHKSTFGLDCQECHTEITWRPQGLISEHQNTRFPLMGVHVVTPCERCHERAPVGEFRGAPVECELCHSRDIYRSQTVDHVAAGFVMDCERCHTAIDWGRAGIQHDFFPLAGGHGGLDCFACHTSSDFRGLPTDCFACHQDDYAAAPNHQAFPTTCDQCHTIFGWDLANINHSFFPLNGGHAGLPCTQCHTGGIFTPISPDCFSCHASDYQGATDHVALGFPTNCEACHNTTDWDDTNFVHNFPLQGDHNVDCNVCHNQGSTRLYDCLSCHDQGQTDDDHSEVNGYVYQSTACVNCHPNGDN